MTRGERERPLSCLILPPKHVPSNIYLDPLHGSHGTIQQIKCIFPSSVRSPRVQVRMSKLATSLAKKVASSIPFRQLWLIDRRSVLGLTGGRGRRNSLTLLRSLPPSSASYPLSPLSPLPAIMRALLRQSCSKALRGSRGPTNRGLISGARGAPGVGLGNPPENPPEPRPGKPFNRRQGLCVKEENPSKKPVK